MSGDGGSDLFTAFVCGHFSGGGAGNNEGLINVSCKNSSLGVRGERSRMLKSSKIVACCVCLAGVLFRMERSISMVLFGSCRSLFD